MSRRSTDNEINLTKEAAKSGEEQLLENIDWAYRMTNQKIYKIYKSLSMDTFIRKQNIRWVAHVCRSSNETLSKQLMFTDVHFTKRVRPHLTVYESVIQYHINNGVSEESFLLESIHKK